MAANRLTIIILIGPPGSGKGTQAARLMLTHHLPKISTGDLLRDQINRRTSLGLKLESYVNSGSFPPDKLILEMLASRISASDCRAGFVLDGFPRNNNQAKTLDKYLKLYNVEPIVILMDTPDAEVKERILNRLICEKCHAPYHLKHAPPKQAGICDQCGGSLIKRSDDSEKVLEYRLEVYREQTAPLIDYYRKRGYLFSIDGTSPPDVAFAQIEHVIALRSTPKNIS